MSATVAPQQAAAIAAPGMQRIPLPLESYETISPPLSSKRLVNMYAEQEPSDARTQAALMPTAGLLPSGFTFGTGPIKAMNSDYPGAIYIVSGTHAYRLSQLTFGDPPVITDLGDIGAPTGVSEVERNLMVTIAVSVNAVVFCVPPNAFTCGHTDPVVNQIGGDFPGARSVTELDGYMVFTSTNVSAQFFISLLLDPGSFDALDFAFADGVPNIIRRAVTLRGELWLIGESGLEIWYDAGSSGLETMPGTSFFPFRRQSGGVLPHGTVSIKSVVVIDGSLFWVGVDSVVYRSNGYRAQRISTHGIEETLRVYHADGALSAIGFVHMGHTCYAVNFPNESLVYDCATQLWHERSSAANGIGTWLPQAVCQVGYTYLFGSSTSGRAFTLDESTDTDDGVAQYRQIVLPPIWAGTRRAFCARLEIEMEVGGLTPPGNLLLEWSDDGGWSWTGVPRTLFAGDTLGYRGRVVATRLGSFRQRVFRISGQNRMTLYAVDADITSGAH